MVSFARKASQFSKHVASCMLFGMQKVVYPRHLILSESCAGAGARQRTLKTFYIDFSHASSLCVWLQDKWILSELNYSHKGRRFFDSDFDSSKSLLHVLAQRTTRASPAQTCDREFFSPSLMHLDDDGVDLVSQVRARSECPITCTVRCSL